MCLWQNAILGFYNDVIRLVDHHVVELSTSTEGTHLRHKSAAVRIVTSLNMARNNPYSNLFEAILKSLKTRGQVLDLAVITTNKTILNQCLWVTLMSRKCC